MHCDYKIRAYILALPHHNRDEYTLSEMGPKTGKSGVGDRAEKAPGQAAAKKGFAADRDLGDLEEKAYEGMSDSDDDGLTRAERKKLHRKASKQSRKARSMWEGDSGWSELQASAHVRVHSGCERADLFAALVPGLAHLVHGTTLA